MHRALKCRSLSIARDLETPLRRSQRRRRGRQLRNGQPWSHTQLRAGAARRLPPSRTPTSDRRILHPRCIRFGSRSSRRTLACQMWLACTSRRSSTRARSRRETCQVTPLFARHQYCAISIAPCGCPFAADSLARGSSVLIGSAQQRSRFVRGVAIETHPSSYCPPCRRGQQWLPPPVSRSV